MAWQAFASVPCWRHVVSDLGRASEATLDVRGLGGLSGNQPPQRGSVAKSARRIVEGALFAGSCSGGGREVVDRNQAGKGVCQREACFKRLPQAESRGNKSSASLGGHLRRVGRPPLRWRRRLCCGELRSIRCVIGACRVAQLVGSAADRAKIRARGPVVASLVGASGAAQPSESWCLQRDCPPRRNLDPGVLSDSSQTQGKSALGLLWNFAVARYGVVAGRSWSQRFLQPKLARFLLVCAGSIEAAD